MVLFDKTWTWRIRIWGRKGKRFQRKYVQEIDRLGGGSVMAWPRISADYRTYLVFFYGYVNVDVYVDELLWAHVVTFSRKHKDIAILTLPIQISQYMRKSIIFAKLATLPTFKISKQRSISTIKTLCRATLLTCLN